MCMDVDGSFHEVIRLKRHAATCQPRFHAHTRTGVFLKKPENSDVNIRWAIQNVAKVTWEEALSISHWALQTQTNLTSENWRTPALLKNSGKFRRYRKKKQTISISNAQRKLQFLNNITGFLQTTSSSQLRNTCVPQASNVHLNSIRPNQRLNILPGSSSICLF